MEVKLRTLTGEAATPYLPELARLRIAVFREWPYLYDGDLGYERAYLQTYVQAKDSVLVLALHDDRVVGAATGMPMAEETPEVQHPFREQGYDIASVFYYGESVLEKTYRGRGVGVRFFDEREAWARKLDRFERLAFCGVQRPADHPRRPAHYTPLDSFWRKRGFTPTDLYSYFSWKDLDAAEESKKPLRYWMKRLY